MDRIIRIVIADDHPMFRYGLRVALQANRMFEVVGEASTGQEAVDLAVELAPDVVVMDLTMPGLNGVEATRNILAVRPQVNILVVTMFDDSASVLTAIRAGARGYLVKGADGEEMLRAIHAAAAGEAIFGPAAAHHITQHLTDAASVAPPALPGLPTLTTRERELLRLIAAGYTNAAITERLALSPKTVRNYISALLAKLGVNTRTEAIARARAASLGAQADTDTGADYGGTTTSAAGPLRPRPNLSSQ